MIQKWEQSLKDLATRQVLFFLSISKWKEVHLLFHNSYYDQWNSFQNLYYDRRTSTLNEIACDENQEDRKTLGTINKFSYLAFDSIKIESLLMNDVHECILVFKSNPLFLCIWSEHEYTFSKKSRIFVHRKSIMLWQIELTLHWGEISRLKYLLCCLSWKIFLSINSY